MRPCWRSGTKTGDHRAGASSDRGGGTCARRAQPASLPIVPRATDRRPTRALLRRSHEHASSLQAPLDAAIPTLAVRQPLSVIDIHRYVSTSPIKNPDLLAGPRFRNGRYRANLPCRRQRRHRSSLPHGRFPAPAPTNHAPQRRRHTPSASVALTAAPSCANLHIAPLCGHHRLPFPAGFLH